MKHIKSYNETIYSYIGDYDKVDFEIDGKILKPGDTFILKNKIKWNNNEKRTPRYLGRHGNLIIFDYSRNGIIYETEKDDIILENNIKEAKIIDKAPDLNSDSLIQIVDKNDKNYGNAKIVKKSKNLYYIKYKFKNLKVKKSDININIHGQAQVSNDKLYEIDNFNGGGDYPGPNLINNAPSVGTGGSISGDNEPVGAEWKGTGPSSTTFPDKYIQKIKNPISKESRRRRNALKKLMKLDKIKTKNKIKSFNDFH